MRIAIVNDVPLAVEALRRTIILSGQHEVAWTAANGREAVEKCACDTPDLLLMDLIMPVMNGVEAIGRIMRDSPCLILVVTASIDAQCAKVFEAMGAGALDVVKTPNLSDAAGQQQLIRKIEILGRLGGRYQRNSPRPEAALPLVSAPPVLVAIGCSAGGPAALVELLGGLPGSLDAGIVIIQHVDAQFASGLATWLDGQTDLTVRCAREGDRLESGTALLAATDNHLAFTGPGRLGYVDVPPGLSYRPSVDVFFASVAKYWKQPVIAVILTGMGRDGAQGMKELKLLGHTTIVQDQATSAVYGMPKAAFEFGAASEVLPLNRIADRIRSHIDRLRRGPA